METYYALELSKEDCNAAFGSKLASKQRRSVLFQGIMTS